jgi:DNA invertase Pin-like site-specific DNA recombinase
MTNDKPVLLGYIRVSTSAQDEASQHLALDEAKVPKRNRFIDHGYSGAKVDRPGLTDLLADARAERAQGHDVTIVTYALDRLGRSAAHVLTMLDELDHEGIRVHSIRDGIDTSTSQGRIFAKLLSVVADLERSFIQERTRQGLAAAKAKGHFPGRPKVESAKARKAQTLRNSGESVPEIAKTLGVSIATVYRLTKKPQASA